MPGFWAPSAPRDERSPLAEQWCGQLCYIIPLVVFSTKGATNPSSPPLGPLSTSWGLFVCWVLGEQLGQPSHPVWLGRCVPLGGSSCRVRWGRGLCLLHPGTCPSLEDGPGAAGKAKHRVESLGIYSPTRQRGLGQ